MSEWKSLNYKQPIPDVNKPFSIICPKETDIYDKPPSTHRFDAPVIYTTTNVGVFKSATVTIKADWKFKYDQGGFCIIVNLKDGTRKWLKTGIEFVDGTPLISVVTKDRWADWSLRPLLDPESRAGTIHVEVDEDRALWVYALGADGHKHLVREVTWWAEFEADTEVQIGPAAAKPSAEGGDLIVDFTDFKLVTA